MPGIMKGSVSAVCPQKFQENRCGDYKHFASQPE